MLYISRCYFNLQNGKKAVEYCLKALSINADFKEAYCFMAELSGPKNRKCWYRNAKLATNENVLFERQVKMVE